MTKQSSNRLNVDHTITLRPFLGTTALSSSALMSGGLMSLLRQSASAAGGFDFVEKSILELQDAMASGRVTSKGLVMGYVERINSFNGLLHSVIETNPDAVSIAEDLDNERRHGHVRGPLHGIPILVKDNIATDDRMETTAGSFALVGSQVPADAVIIHRLRDAGAVILGKANLGEWANFRADGAQRHRCCNSSRRVAVAIWPCDRASASPRLHAVSPTRCTQRCADRTRCALFRLQLLRQRHSGRPKHGRVCGARVERNGKPRRDDGGHRYI